jgi:hypothetical protein
MSHHHDDQPDQPDQPDQDGPGRSRALPRRGLMALSGAAAVGGVALVFPSPAEAATGSTAWKLGGNSGVKSDGSNFLGTKNAAPLIFKTKSSGGHKPVERMRILPGGRIGIGTKSPVAWTECRTASAPVALQGTSLDTTGSAVGVQGTASSNIGVQGDGGYAGVRANGGSYGLIGSGSSSGTYGSGTTYGVYGSGGSSGVFGSGSTYGVYGNGGTNGVYGYGSTYGVVGQTDNPNSDGVHGIGGQYGVHGASGRTAGVRGDSGYVGTWGQATTFGAYGLATDSVSVSYGLFGQASNASSFAIYSNGNLAVNGTLSKSAGSFKIDHPLDPEHKWLYHSFVESPDMMNVYNGNVVLDGNGEATIELPDYFSALNQEFRYQLTTIGAHAPVFVKTEIADNRFSIGGGHAGLKVSWQVTGIRHDDYAESHRIPVEQAKTKAEKGTRAFVPQGSAATLMKIGPKHAPQEAANLPAPPALTQVSAPEPHAGPRRPVRPGRSGPRAGPGRRSRGRPTLRRRERRGRRGWRTRSPPEPSVRARREGRRRGPQAPRRQSPPSP